MDSLGTTLTLKALMTIGDPSSLSITLERRLAIGGGQSLPVATLFVGGGYLTGGYSLQITAGGALAGIGIITLANNTGGGVQVILTAAEQPGSVTITATADDDHSNTPAATAVWTLQVVDGLTLSPPFAGVLVITTHNAAGIIPRDLGVFAASGADGALAFALAPLPPYLRLQVQGENVMLRLIAAPLITGTIVVPVSVSETAQNGRSSAATATLYIANPPSMTLALADVANLVLTGVATVATVSVAGGYVDSDYLLGISGLPNAGLVAGGGRTIVVLTANVAITATIVITADDNHPNILPMTASAIITVADRLFIGGGGFAAVTADLGGQRQQLAILRAFGGLPSYNFGELSGDDELFDLASGGDAATVSILVNTWANYTSHQPLVSVSLTVGDSSTPGLSATAAITVSLALPPVVLSLGYAAAGYTAGLSSVTLVSVLASGGADDLQQVLGYTFENVGVLAAGISALSSGGLVLSSTIPATLTATIRVRDNYRDDDDIFVSITLRLTALAADIEIDEAGAPFPHPETGAAFAIVTLTTRGGDGEVTLGVPADADYGIINVSVRLITCRVHWR